MSTDKHILEMSRKLQAASCEQASITGLLRAYSLKLEADLFEARMFNHSK